MPEILPCPEHPDAEPWVSAGGVRVFADSTIQCHVHCSASSLCWSGPSAWGYEAAVKAWNRALQPEQSEEGK